MNPFLGVVFHWLGGLASGSFYVPYKGVRKWAWEVYWLVGGVFSWILVPWLLALLMTSDLTGVLSSQNATTLWWTYFFGAMWGWIFHEWKGASKKAHNLIGAGIALLILSTIIIGYGTYLKAHGPGN